MSAATAVRRTAPARTALPVDLGDGPFAITTRGVSKHYGNVAALNGLELQIPDGAVYVLVGPNGAGKSTLIRLLMGLTRRSDGDVSVLGLDPGARGGEVRGRVGYVPEGHALGYPWMTVGRLLEHHAAYHPTWDEAYARRLAETYEVDPTRKCRAMSKGQSRRVQLILALAHRPPLLLLDEPTDGLDHVIRDETLSILSEHLADTPTTVLISTHRVYEVERLVDHVGVLSNGRLLGQLPRESLHRRLRRYRVDVAEEWGMPTELNGAVVRRAGGPRTIELTVWGNPERVTGELARSGATVSDVAPLTIDDAATVLLSRKESA